MIMIWAPTHTRAMNWAKAHRLDPRDIKYISKVDDLYGRPPMAIIDIHGPEDKIREFEEMYVVITTLRHVIVRPIQ